MNKLILILLLTLISLTPVLASINNVVVIEKPTIEWWKLYTSADDLFSYLNVSSLNITGPAGQNGTDANITILNQKLNTTSNTANPTIDGNMTFNNIIINGNGAVNTDATLKFMENTLNRYEIFYDGLLNGLEIRGTTTRKIMTFNVYNSPETIIHTNLTVVGNLTTQGQLVCLEDGTNCPVNTTMISENLTNEMNARIGNDSTLVPYLGATANVDLGGFDLTAHNLYTSYLGGTVGSLDMAINPWKFHANLSPSATLQFNLGSGALRWNWLYVRNISVEDIDAYSLHLSKNLTIDGEIFIINKGINKSLNALNDSLISLKARELADNSTQALKIQALYASNTTIWANMLSYSALIPLQQANATMRSSNASQALKIQALYASNTTIWANMLSWASLIPLQQANGTMRSSNASQALSLAGLRASNSSQALRLNALESSNTTQNNQLIGLRTSNTTVNARWLASNLSQSLLIRGLLTSNSTLTVKKNGGNNVTNAKIWCKNITGGAGTDTDFCTDATGAGSGTPFTSINVTKSITKTAVTTWAGSINTSSLSIATGKVVIIECSFLANSSLATVGIQSNITFSSGTTSSRYINCWATDSTGASIYQTGNKFTQSLACSPVNTGTVGTTQIITIRAGAVTTSTTTFSVLSKAERTGSINIFPSSYCRSIEI
jgi:hypothetical protein